MEHVRPPQPPQPPYDLPLNATMQLIATVILWSSTALLLAYAIKARHTEIALFFPWY